MPVLLDDGGRGPTAVRRRADVALVDGASQALVLEFAGECFCCLSVSALAGRYVGALLGEAVGDGGADSARPAGDKRDAAVQGRAPGW